MSEKISSAEVRWRSVSETMNPYIETTVATPERRQSIAVDVFTELADKPRSERDEQLCRDAADHAVIGVRSRLKWVSAEAPMKLWPALELISEYVTDREAYNATAMAVYFEISRLRRTSASVTVGDRVLGTVDASDLLGMIEQELDTLGSLENPQKSTRRCIELWSILRYLKVRRGSEFDEDRFNAIGQRMLIIIMGTTSEQEEHMTESLTAEVETLIDKAEAAETTQSRARLGIEAYTKLRQLEGQTDPDWMRSTGRRLLRLISGEET